MKYRFTFSSEDSDQTKDFDNLRDAEEYMGEFIKGVERWSNTTFWPYDSHTSFRLFKDRKGRVIKIDKIKSNKPLGLKIKKRYVNSDGKLVTDLLPFNFETNEAIRKERELMPPENYLTRSEIDLYLNDGFTINTYQASYCKEGHEFSPIEESK